MNKLKKIQFSQMLNTVRINKLPYVHDFKGKATQKLTCSK